MRLRVFIAIIVLSGCGAPEPAEPETAATPSTAEPERSTAVESGEWSGIVDGEYAASHGWGHVYRCRVREVREGSTNTEELSLNVTVGTEWLDDDEQQPFRGMLMRFRSSDRPYGPPSGYRDPESSVYWVLVSATPSE